VWCCERAWSGLVLEADAAAPTGHDLRVESAQDQICREWYGWWLGTPDIGMLTATVVRRAADTARADGHYAPRAADFRTAAQAAPEDLPRTAGTGSMLRTHAAELPYMLYP